MQRYVVEVYENRTEWKNEQDHLHRLDGPAVEYAGGYKEWYFNGQRHRLDGPAVEYAGGYKEYWIDGKELSKEEFIQRTQTKELSVADIEKLLGYPVKIIKNC